MSMRFIIFCVALIFGGTERRREGAASPTGQSPPARRRALNY